VNNTNRQVAGIEDYLAAVIPALHRQKHQLGFVHEVAGPESREFIPLPNGIPSWNVSLKGVHQTLQDMRSWNPDVIYAHGPLHYRFEAGFQRIAPSVYFAHNYYGACISGLKTLKFPRIQPCQRRFGAGCLLHYLPRACGGRNPITMWRLFRRESRKRANLSKYNAIVTHSSHMRAEYIRNGFPESRVHNFVDHITCSAPISSGGSKYVRKTDRRGWNLLFVGRMEVLKGGEICLDALPFVARRLSEPIRLVFAGDGPERSSWEKKAQKLSARHPDIHVEFTGWLGEADLSEVYARTDLLVVPSLWPEPFGRVGLEAGLHGVPAAAFKVGGISDWLMDGINGHLAPSPASGSALAEAIVSCLQDRDVYTALCAGAARVAKQFSIDNHVHNLMTIFERFTKVTTHSAPDPTTCSSELQDESFIGIRR
jgi:glycosyltransferase involved in cell wall biosynthesis